MESVLKGHEYQQHFNFTGVQNSEARFSGHPLPALPL
jgi:hypothetical protein